MRFLRSVFVPVLLLPLLLTATWHWRNTLGETAATFGLQLLGVEVTELDIREIDTNHCRIEKLVVVDRQYDWQVESTGIDIRYQIKQLLQGQLQGISLERAIVTTGVKSSPSGRSEFDPLGLLALIRGSWRERIPFQEARLGRIELRGEGFGVASGEVLSATLTRQESMVSARVELLDRPETPRAVTIDSLDSNQTVIMLHDGRDIDPTAIELQFAINSVNAEAVFDLASMREWLLPIAGETLPESTRGAINGKFHVQIEEHNDFNLSMDIAAQSLQFGELSLKNLSAKIGAHGSTQAQLVQLNLEPDSRIRLQSLRYPTLQFTSGNVDLAGLLQQTPEGWHFALEPQSRGIFTSLSFDKNRAEKLIIDLDSEVMRNTENTRLRLSPEFRAAFVDLQLGDVKFPGLSVRPQYEATIFLDGEEPANWRIKPGKWHIDPGKIIADNQTSLQPSAIQLTLDKLGGNADRWELASTLDFDRLLLKSGDLELPLRDVTTTLFGNNQHIELAGELLTTGNPAELSFVVKHHLTHEEGSMKLSTPDGMVFSTPDFILSKLFNYWPYHFDFVSGSLDLELLLTWTASSPTRLSARVGIEDGGGNLEEALFSGLRMNSEFEMLPTLRSTGSAEVKLESLDYGIMLHDITTHLTLQPTVNGPKPLLLAEQIDGGAYNARFSSRRLIYDFNTSSGNLNLTLDGVDLAHLVELSEMADLTATGILNGYIPVKINASGVKVEDGRLWNRPPGGVLSYHTEGENPPSDPDSAMTGYVLRALRDYRYHQFAANMLYEPEGTMILDIQLKGISPAIDPQRPVHLNIKLEQNLLTLLQSLRYSQGLNEELDNRVRRHFENKTGLQ